MPFEITVDTAARVLLVRYSGEVGMDDRLRLARQVLEKAQATGIFRWLLDFRRAQSRGADPSGTRCMADEFTSRFPPGVRMAYLLTYDHQLDDSLEKLLRARGVPVERFRDLDAAMTWLQAVDDDVAATAESTALTRAPRGSPASNPASPTVSPAPTLPTGCQRPARSRRSASSRPYSNT